MSSYARANVRITIIKKQKENSHEGITWSEMGKQNVQAKNVYCASALFVYFFVSFSHLWLFFIAFDKKNQQCVVNRLNFDPCDASHVGCSALIWNWSQRLTNSVIQSARKLFIFFLFYSCILDTSVFSWRHSNLLYYLCINKVFRMKMTLEGSKHPARAYHSFFIAKYTELTIFCFLSIPRFLSFL